MLKFAIPTIDRKLSTHFGRCDEFAIIEVQPVRSSPTKQNTHSPFVPIISGLRRTGDEYQETSNEVKDNELINIKFVNPPQHERGIFPKWLAEQGVTHIISAGMGRKAQAIFEENNIEVCIGAEAKTPEELVTDYLNNNLIKGENVCEH